MYIIILSTQNCKQNIDNLVSNVRGHEKDNEVYANLFSSLFGDGNLHIIILYRTHYEHP